ncbi:hypothetical protein DZ662_28580 [Salmonella enterica]|nr:hypothetical protein [Salmonella enterica]
MLPNPTCIIAAEIITPEITNQAAEDVNPENITSVEAKLNTLQIVKKVKLLNHSGTALVAHRKIVDKIIIPIFISFPIVDKKGMNIIITYKHIAIFFLFIIIMINPYFHTFKTLIQTQKNIILKNEST